MSARILRPLPIINYQEGSAHGHRKILGANLTASITKHAKEILDDASALRVSETITHFLVDFTLSSKLKIPLSRARTDSQGASSSNTAFTPSKHNEARHVEIAATVHAKLRGPLQEISSSIETKNALTPQTDRELKLLKLKTPKRAAIAQSPARAGEILKDASQKPVDILKNTYYGNRKHMTYSSLSISNQFDRMVEFRLRPLWDKLMEKANTKNISPTKTTIEFVESFEKILTHLHSLSSDLQIHLKDFFDLEEKLFTLTVDDPEYLPTLKKLSEHKTWICSNFSSCREINAIKHRREDWYWVKKAVNGEPQALLYLRKVDEPEDKQRVLDIAKNLLTEATFQLENVKAANNQLVIENLNSCLFGEKTESELKSALLNMLSPLPVPKKIQIQPSNITSPPTTRKRQSISVVNMTLSQNLFNLPPHLPEREQTEDHQLGLTPLVFDD